MNWEAFFDAINPSLYPKVWELDFEGWNNGSFPIKSKYFWSKRGALRYYKKHRDDGVRITLISSFRRDCNGHQERTVLKDDMHLYPIPVLSADGLLRKL